MRYIFGALSSYGFVFPAIGIASELRRRGHEVAFATDPTMQPVLDAEGLERIPRGPKDGPSFQIQFAGHPVESMRQFRHLTYAAGIFSPDVIVGTELAHGTVVAGEYHGLPTAMVGLGAFLWATEATPRLDDPRHSSWIQRRYQNWLTSFDLTRSALGLPSRAVDADNPLLGDLYFLRTVPELEGLAESEALPARVHLVGGCLWGNAQEDRELEEWLTEAIASSEPIIYAQLGRFFEKPSFWLELVKALGNSGIRVAVSVGRMDRPVDAVPPNFFVRGHVPQELVLPHAWAVVCTSTTTAVIGALSRGIPLVLIPGGGGGEQADLIHRCRRAGVARYVPASRATAASIGEALAEVLDQAGPVGLNARALRPAFERAGGIPDVADHLERLGRGRVAARRSQPAASS